VYLCPNYMPLTTTLGEYKCLFSNLTFRVGDEDDAKGEDEDTEGDLDERADVPADFSFVLGYSEHLDPDVRPECKNRQGCDESDVVTPNLVKNRKQHFRFIHFFGLSVVDCNLDLTRTSFLWQ
jgi:hypothetical protein